MPRKTPNFGGLSLKDVAKANTEAENKNSIAKSDNSNDNISNAKNRATKLRLLDKENSTAKNNNAASFLNLSSNAQNRIAINGISTPPPSNDKNSTANGAISDNSTPKNSTAINNVSIENTNIAKISIAKNSIAKNVNQALFARVRDYFYNLLGENESAEVKFSEVIQDLEINPHSFYKYFRTLRETDFVVTKLRYSTEIRKRTASE